MSPKPGMPTTIPARPTVMELAEALGVSVEQVQAVLAARQQAAVPSDMVGPEVSLTVAKALAVHVTIEPRDLALEALYALDTRVDAEFSDLGGKALRLVKGVAEHREILDHEIEEASKHWSVARMPIIDRAILRLGLYELRHEAATPTAVIVSEAVRLAKTYSTEKSGSFVNGVLGSLAGDSRS